MACSVKGCPRRRGLATLLEDQWEFSLCKEHMTEYQRGSYLFWADSECTEIILLEPFDYLPTHPAVSTGVF